MCVPEKIKELVEKFDKYKGEYLKPSYKEYQVCKDFIDPFFEALGWDVQNTKGYSEKHREVIQQYSEKIGGTTKAPDYAFKIGPGKPIFFVEAKKPSVDLKKDTRPAHQLRTYAWNAKLDISILTDFQEFAIYDCRSRYHKDDASHVNRVGYFKYTEYINRWAEIDAIFSRKNVPKNSIEDFLGKKSKRGAEPVDKVFLETIEDWRNGLAGNIYLKNPNLTVSQLNTAVQRTIDRILFLRICEDRGIEKPGQLLGLINGNNVYKRLVDLYYQADNRYNSGLFHFNREYGIKDEPDEFTPNLTISDQYLRNIIKSLYYPESPYDFNALPADILGQVYEQFLGRVIRVTSTTGKRMTRPKVEEKPEVRKAGGVYYTPKYIVDYIVENTVGKLVEGKTPKQVAKLKILDPACGSGSFLLGAYQYLLDWHLEWYESNDPESHTKKKNAPICKTREDKWRLTASAKKSILTNSIYGVDIDRQAVEVTKLNLLLKVLEGEVRESLIGYRALPDLASNIKCGNSLIETDYFDRDDADMSEWSTINPFDWKVEFPDIVRWKTPPTPPDRGGCEGSPSFSSRGDIIKSPPPRGGKGGLKEIPDPLIKGVESSVEDSGGLQHTRELEDGYGFDAVIGNPPYVRQESLKNIKSYLKKKYAVYNGIADIYVYFFERSLSSLRKDGYFGYIVANKWLRAKYGKSLRKYLSEKQVEQIIDFGDLEVFEGVSTYPCVTIIRNRERTEPTYAYQPDSLDFDDLDELFDNNNFEVAQSSLCDDRWSLIGLDTQNIINKMSQNSVELGNYVNGEIYYGIKTGFNKAFIIDEDTKDRLIAEDPNSADIIKPILAGRDIKRYEPLNVSKFLIFARRGINIDDYPTIKDYLLEFRKELTPKPKDYVGDWSGRKPGTYKWYEIQDTIDYYKEFEKPKIIYPNICKKPEFTYDNDNYYTNQKCFIIPGEDKFLLGILNSRLNYFLFMMILPKLRGDFFEPSYAMFKHFPIRAINSNNPTDRAMHDQMVSLVERMLELNERLMQARMAHEKTQLKRQIEFTDNRIDQLVYRLYDLTPEEIAIVEQSFNE